jgi:hypothetical protein
MLKAVWYDPSLQRTDVPSRSAPCWLMSVEVRDGWNGWATIVLDISGTELPLRCVPLKEVKVLRRLGLDITEP